MWCLSISYHLTLIYRKTCQHKLGRSKGNNNKKTKAQTLFFTSSQELESRVLPSTAFSFLFTTPPPTMNNEINNKTGNKCYSTIHSLHTREPTKITPPRNGLLEKLSHKKAPAAYRERFSSIVLATTIRARFVFFVIPSSHINKFLSCCC